MSTQIHIYQDSQITFRNEDGLLVNSTEMAKAFGKQTRDYLKTDATKEFIAAYMEENSVKTNPVTVIQGGSNQGTWMHEDIALDFAQWLSPKFKVWVNARIKELLTTGGVSLSLEQQTLNVIGHLQARVQQLESKANYCDNVLNSDSLLTVTEVAASLPGGFTPNRVNEVLMELGVQHKERGIYYLYAKYKHRGYEGYRIDTVPRKDGSLKSVQLMCFTEKGRKWIAEGFARHNISPKAPKKVAAAF